MEKLQALARADRYQNSLLHYAAATQCNALIKEALAAPNLQVTATNQWGESADTWVKDYVFFTSPFGGGYDELPPAIATGNINVVRGFLKLQGPPGLRFLVDDVIQTPLHLAISHSKPEMVALLLEGRSPAQTTELLASRNGHGQTPLEVAQEVLQGQQGRLEAQQTLELIERTASQAASAVVPVRSVSPLSIALTENYIEHLNLLNERGKAGIKESDYPILRPTMTTVCTLAYFTCRQALSLLQTLTTASPKKYPAARSLLRDLFDKKADGTTPLLTQLQKQIGPLADYLAATLREKAVDQIFQLVNDDVVPPPFMGECYPTKKIIYVNLIARKNITVLALMQFIIHETSHMVTRSYDFAYSKDGAGSPQPESYIKYFVSNEKLVNSNDFASTGTAGPISQKKMELAEIRYNLSCVSAEQPGTIGQWKALNNADNIADATIFLVALESGHGKVRIFRDTDGTNPSRNPQVFNQIRFCEYLARSKENGVAVSSSRNYKKSSPEGLTYLDSSDSDCSTGSSRRSIARSAEFRMAQIQMFKQDLAKFNNLLGKATSVQGPNLPRSGSDSQLICPLTNVQ